MKSLIYTTIGIILTSNFLFAQSADTTIENIREKYNEIHENLKSYDTVSVDLDKGSTEGGRVIAYYDNSELKMIEAVWRGETGKRIIDCCYDNEKIIFAFDRKFIYNRPIYWDKNIATENGDNEVFNPDKTTINENRYYFKNGKLILWLNNDNNEVSLTDGKNKLAFQELMTQIYQIKGKLKKTGTQ